MKTLRLFCLFACLSFYGIGHAHNYSDVSIYAGSTPAKYDLSGTNGEDGISGPAAYALDCTDGIVRNGRDGENGQNGENGQSGKDAFIYYNDLSDLKNITLIQNGGVGGAPGGGGEGTLGCFGGGPGKLGHPGNKGKNGEFGEIYLFHDDDSFSRGNRTKVISLLEFSKGDLLLSRPIWSTHDGARELFNENSIIKSYYKKYEGQASYRVTLKWSSPKDIHKYSDAQLALSINHDELNITSYRGPILDFRITRNENHYVFEIFDANADTEFKNLDFGRMRGYGEDIVLEIIEIFSPDISVETKFVLSLYVILDGQQDLFLAQFQLSDSDVIKEGKSFFVKLGKLNFPSRFKRKGTKLRINLSVYRSARMQTRVFPLKGIFKI